MYVRADEINGEVAVDASEGANDYDIIAVLEKALTRIKGHEDSSLVDHARRELELINEEPSVIAGYLKIVQAFADMGHSGGSAAVAIPVINALLRFKNLKPLTDDPNEWAHHDEDVWGQDGGIWQNKRNSEAFSQDGGKTYYLLSEVTNIDQKTWYHSTCHVTGEHPCPYHPDGGNHPEGRTSE